MTTIGVKFACTCRPPLFEPTPELGALHSSAYLFSTLGLAPLHPEGAYGNFSCRNDRETFFISVSGMSPQKEFAAHQFCLIEECCLTTMSLTCQGCAPPSSETLMHYLIYQKRPEIRAILHGHCEPMTRAADALKIPQTPHFHPYGTRELAMAGAELAAREDLFVLRNHGFIVLGKDVATATAAALRALRRTITHLEQNFQRCCPT